MEAPRRILMVTPRYLPEIGGVERHVYEVSRRLAAGGCEVTILTTDRTGALPPHEVRDGVTVCRVRAWPARRDLYVAPRVDSEIRAGDWDIVHVQSYHTFVAPLAMRAARRAGLPFVVTFHGGGHSSRVRSVARRPQRRALRPLLARARWLVAVARFEVALYSRELRLPPERFIVIPNGTDLPAPPARAQVPDDGPLIASVGRLERYKGHHRAIAALPHVLERQPHARLWLAGTGPYEQRLRRQAERLGIAERVDIHGVPAGDRETMAAELARASLVVLLSQFETQPIAALEARALGRPLLVADTSGLRELAERGQARAVPLAASPREVAEAMLEQLRRPLAAEHPPPFTWDDCAAALLHLYESVLEEARCGS